MGIKFKTVGASRPLVRYRLQFENLEDLNAVVELQRENGCVRFNNDKEKNLMGKVVRVSRNLLMLEVDAVVDIDQP